MAISPPVEKFAGEEMLHGKLQVKNCGIMEVSAHQSEGLGHVIIIPLEGRLKGEVLQ